MRQPSKRVDSTTSLTKTMLACVGMLCLLLSASSMLGCGGDDGADVCAAADAPTYDNFGKQFVSDYCLRCHGGDLAGVGRMGAPEAYKFDTLALIESRSDDMRDAVVVTMTMPFGSTSRKPTAAERARFGQWLDCGARE